MYLFENTHKMPAKSLADARLLMYNEVNQN